MKKIFIALSLAGLSTLSMADVVLYGKIRGGLEVQKIKGVAGTTTEIIDYSSRIGFRGKEQLNDKLSVIWQIEQRVDIKGDSAKTRGFGTRGTYIGLKGQFGEVRAGYQHNPVGDYLDNYGVWEFGKSLAASPNVYDNGTDVTKRRVSVQYISPSINDFSTTLYVSPSDNNSSKLDGVPNNPTAKTKDSAAYMIGLHYAPKQGFYGDVVAGYVRNGANNVRGDKGYHLATVFGYKTQNALFRGSYQYSRDVDNDPFELNNGETNITRMNQASLTAAYSIPNSGWTPKISAAYGWGIREAAPNQAEYTSMGNGKYWQVLAGASYKFSKRTTSHIQAGYLSAGKKTDKSDQLQIYALGLGFSHQF